MKTSIVIPNWNGEKLLQKNLPKVFEIGANEMIIVDDGSSDGSRQLLAQFKTKYPELTVIQHEKNQGFARSVNDGFSRAGGDVVILLNTDVTPRQDLLAAVLPRFKNMDVFAVSFNEGKWSFAKGIFHHGFIEHRPGEKLKAAKESFWASGGSAAFDKDKWSKLGGLDTIFSPFYWEDLDISYRAQMRGWKILWEPKAHVRHEHESTIGRFFSQKKKTWVSDRNQLIFFWKNISSVKFWILHILWLPIRLMRPGYWAPFLWAFFKVPVIIKRRIENRGKRRLTDEQILARFQN